MKRFLDLRALESVGLDVCLYRNANSLKKDSELLYDMRNSIASANSLLVLSSEEIIKAILVFLHSKNYKVYKLNEANKFFRDHKIRHKIAQLIEMGAAFVEAFDVWNNRKKRLTFSFETKYSWLNDILNTLGDLDKASKPFLNSLERIKKLERFNDDKNNGFYVDYRNKILSPQQLQDKSLYTETLMIVDRLFRFYKILKILHHPSLVKHLPENEIKVMLRDLDTFLNQGLEEFTFKN